MSVVSVVSVVSIAPTLSSRESCAIATQCVDVEIDEPTNCLRTFRTLDGLGGLMPSYATLRVEFVY